MSRSKPPRWLRWTLAGVAAALLCLMFGITTAKADLSLGPHEATYAITADDEVVADLGPLGTVVTDSPLPLTLGVRITVHEIPADLAAVDAASFDALAGDLDGYLQFFDTPQRTVRTVATALVWDALRGAAGAAVVLVGGAYGLRLLLGAARRRELARSMAARTWEITAATVVVVLVAATATASAGPEERAALPASPVFAGTALEGARITGRLAGVIDTYSGQLVDTYQANEVFYAGAREKLMAAWDARVAEQDAAPVEDGATASADPDAPDYVTFLVVSDLHCNTGMTPLIRDLADSLAPDVMLNAGDTTINGTSVESVCVDSFASAVPDGVPFVVSDGNHDSRLTTATELANRQVVLDGEVVEVEGVRILGDRDPLETRIGGGTVIAREETPAEAGERLRDTACEAAGEPGLGGYTGEDRVDLLLIHQPAVGDAALESGCVPFQLSGHMHTRIGPDVVGYGVRYVNASTGGATKGNTSVGPLRDTSEMTVLRFDPERRRFVDWQLVEVTPEGDAAVSERRAVPPTVPLPAEVPDEVPGDVPGAGSTPSSLPSGN
ncbi:metallophosphoesterase family protein [Promicromonospora kroppenstedtii]|uniref:metallophosphoesterase family protein n=1 Tax=Promicromonospora kroppenstedtii TaxID=440482 RepID=UPI0004B204F5|nr:metallophosphoesterase [Promicromonospora kroppenstedtii]